jgi:hypothetical protein
MSSILWPKPMGSKVGFQKLFSRKGFIVPWLDLKANFGETFKVLTN